VLGKKPKWWHRRVVDDQKDSPSLSGLDTSYHECRSKKL